MRRSDLPTINVSDLMRFNPCYGGETRSRLLQFAESSAAWDIIDVLQSRVYPIMDRAWLICRPELLPVEWCSDIIRLLSLPVIQDLRGPLAQSVSDVFQKMSDANFEPVCELGETAPLRQIHSQCLQLNESSEWLQKYAPDTEDQIYYATGIITAVAINNCQSHYSLFPFFETSYGFHMQVKLMSPTDIDDAITNTLLDFVHKKLEAEAIVE